MNATIPTDWPQISWEDFVRFLADRPDYRRESYANMEFYRFNHSDELFACNVEKVVYLRPDFLLSDLE